MNMSMRSKRKKKSAGNKGDKSERRGSKNTPKKGMQSERARGKKGSAVTSREQPESGQSTRVKKKTKEKEPKEVWGGEETAKKMVASGVFNTSTINGNFNSLPTPKPSIDSCPKFKNNLQKIRAQDCPIQDDKLIVLKDAPDNFVCAAKVTIPDFNRTTIIAQIPEVSNMQNVEDFWKMIFQEGIVSIVVAVMPLENSFNLQQIFPLLSGTFANHGKMFINNKKVESAVATTSYVLEVLPDGCSNSLFTTVYHLHNWKQKKGLDNVGELVTTMEKVMKTNENTAFMSMNGTGRSGAMLALFTAMLNIQKRKEANTKEIVEKFRGERCGIVENVEQFSTIHKAMALWFKKKSTDEEILKKVNEFAPGIQ